MQKTLASTPVTRRRDESSNPAVPPYLIVRANNPLFFDWLQSAMLIVLPARLTPSLARYLVKSI